MLSGIARAQNPLQNRPKRKPGRGQRKKAIVRLKWRDRRNYFNRFRPWAERANSDGEPFTIRYFLLASRVLSLGQKGVLEMMIVLPYRCVVSSFLFACALILAGVLISGSAARAADGDDLVGRGKKAYDAKNYEMAIKYFEDAAKKGNADAM